MDPNFKDAHILIVDDKQANIDILEGFLEIQGYINVRSIQDPRMVHDLFREFKPDLILLDLMMPYMSGFDVMASLKPVIPKGVYFPILVLTADITPEAKKLALAGGAKDFLVKPFDLTEVDLRIKNLLEARFLHLQLDLKNRILDEKVQERTRELEVANNELIIAHDLAEAGNRLKTAFMNNISHEVRTPMNGILGFSSLIADPETQAEDIREFIPLLKKSCNRLINTITDYMDISLIASGNVEVHPRDVIVMQEVDDLLARFSDNIELQQISLHTQFPPFEKELVIQTDRELFRKIFSHLLDNAIKFTPGGTVSIGIEFQPGFVEFCFTDTGVGINLEAQERIFEAFIQENSAVTRGYEGSGLGLAIIRGFLKLLGGKIRMKSVKGEGSSFCFSLPFQDNTVADSLKEKPPLNPPEKSLPVILMVDDDEMNLLYLESALKFRSRKIYKATSGQESIDIFSVTPDISIVFMDLKMPGINGFLAREKIKEINPAIPVIAVSAYAMSTDEFRAVEAGFDGYLVKPFEQRELIDMLARFNF
jgi:signal transduction histidine kinase